MKEKKTVWYLFVAIALFSVMMFNCGMGYYCLSLLVVPITSELGLPSAAFSYIFSFYGMGSTLAAVSLPWLTKRIKLNHLIAIGGLLSAGSFLIYSFSPNILPMYIAGAFGGASTVLGGTAVVQLVVAKWYRKGRSTITGIVASASGVGAAVFSPIMGKLILMLGWRTVCILAAGIVILMVSIVGMILVRQSPESVGLEPYGVQEADKTDGKTVKKTEDGISLKESLRTSRFPLFVFGLLCVALSYQIITSSQSAILIEKGGTLEFASYCLSLFSITDMCCKAISGIIIEKWGFRPAAVYCGAALIIGTLVIQILGGTSATMVLFSVCMGFWPTMLVLYGVTVSLEIFGGKYLPQFVSFTQTIMCGCSMLLGPCINWLFGIRGNYNIIIWMIFACAVLFIPIMMILYGKYGNTRKQA